MGDDWDDDSTSAYYKSSGSNFGKGRGFVKPESQTYSSDWPSSDNRRSRNDGYESRGNYRNGNSSSNGGFRRDNDSGYGNREGGDDSGFRSRGSGGGYRNRDSGDSYSDNRDGRESGYKGRSRNQDGSDSNYRNRDDGESYGGGYKGRGSGFGGRSYGESRYGGGNEGNSNEESWGGGESRYGGFKNRDDSESNDGGRGDSRYGSGGGGYRNRDDGESNGGGRGRGGQRQGGFRNRDDNDSNEGGRGGGGGFRNRDGDKGNQDDNGEEKRPPIYVPPELDESESALFESGISTGINFSQYDNIKVDVTGENVPSPISSFDTSGLKPFVLDNVAKAGYKKPTPIQKYSIPILMSGRDLMATAQTGSGKTAAFLLPIVNKLLLDQELQFVSTERCEPRAIIVSPVRELAIQIHSVAKKFAFSSILKIALAYGGTSVGYQKRQSTGAHILVATPGRLNDFIQSGHVGLGNIVFVVLDEADRMLDMGFRPEMEKLFNHETMVSKSERQTLMFSATFSTEVQRLAGSFLKDDYVFISVGIVGGACKDVEQVFYKVDRTEKRSKLKEILMEEGAKGTLLFVETKRNADFIASFLSDLNFPTTSMHGDRFQQQREQALSDIRSGKMDILVCTAVAARGLDIKGIRHVINFDLPKDIDEYVHRIGRTGRVGNSGKATSFYESSANSSLAPSLVKILEQAGQPIPDWLKEEGGDFGEFPSSGGQDYRNDNGGNPAATASSSALDDEWD